MVVAEFAEAVPVEAFNAGFGSMVVAALLLEVSVRSVFKLLCALISLLLLLVWAFCCIARNWAAVLVYSLRLCVEPC